MLQPENARGRLTTRRRSKVGKDTYVYLELLVEAIVHNQAVGHAYAVRLHGMASDVGIVAHIRVVEVRDLLRLRAAVDVEVVERRSTGAHHGCGWLELREGVEQAE